MLDNYVKNETSILHSPESNNFFYKDSPVKIITVFSDKKNPIALVENKDGEIFEVLKDSLYEK